jgi:ectoine hydroxylase-related dioxygenase (phytanoyl-CoA dioxygenase family)
MNATISVRDSYQSDGFFINRDRPLPRELVERAAAGMDAVRRGEFDTGRAHEPSPWKPGDSENILCKIEMPQMSSRAILELVSHPLIGQVAAEASGAKRVQVWWVQLLYKPSTPRNAGGTNVGWHQDRSYWQPWTPDSDLFTAWVALGDVNEDSGPMRFVPGSHTWGLSKNSDFFAQDLEALKSKISIPAGQSWTEVSATLPSGGFSLHDDLTWHGSGPNRSKSPRRGFAIHLRTENSRPVDERREGLTRHIDDPSICPWIYP